jgi:hypothetical protein
VSKAVCQLGSPLQHRADPADPSHSPAPEGASPATFADEMGTRSIMVERPVCRCQHDQRPVGNGEHKASIPRSAEIPQVPDHGTHTRQPETMRQYTMTITRCAHFIEREIKLRVLDSPQCYATSALNQIAVSRLAVWPRRKYPYSV